MNILHMCVKWMLHSMFGIEMAIYEKVDLLVTVIVAPETFSDLHLR